MPRRQRISQLAHRPLEYRVPRLRRDFSQGFEDETALVQSGMWDGQPLHLDDRVPEQKYVNVDGARAFFLYSPASHLPFNVEDPSQQLLGHLCGVELDGAIQEPWLSGEFHRLGFVER